MAPLPTPPSAAADPEHPWAGAWSVLSPLRRRVLWSTVAGVTTPELARQIGRPEPETETLVDDTRRQFRREVALDQGTGYEGECATVVLRHVDSAPWPLTAEQRAALRSHGQRCVRCFAAVGEVLAVDARLGDGLVELLRGGPTPDGGAERPGPGGPVVPHARRAEGLRGRFLGGSRRH